MISQYRMLASWKILFFIFRLCKSVIHATPEPLLRHATVGHTEALLSSFSDDDLFNVASDSDLDHQTANRKSSNKRVLPWELDPIRSQELRTIDEKADMKSGLGRSASEADLPSRGIFSGKTKAIGLRPVTTGRKSVRGFKLRVPGTNFFQEKSVGKNPISTTISPTSVLDISSDPGRDKASSLTMSAAEQHMHHVIPSSKHFGSMENSPPSSTIKELVSGPSSIGMDSLFNEAVAPNVDIQSTDSVENSNDIERSAGSERHGRLRLYLPRPHLVKAPPSSRTRRLTKAPGILDSFYDKLYEERAVISSFTKRILDIVVHDLATLDSESLPALLELKTLLISVGGKLSNLHQHTFVRLYTTFSLWQESRIKALEILEKVSIMYSESMRQLKDTSAVLHAHEYPMSRKFLRMIRQQFLEVGLGRFKSHVDELMRQVEEIAPREYGKKLDPLDIILDAHEQAPFRIEILGVKGTSQPIETENVHRDLDSMVGARVSGVLIIDDMLPHIRMLQKVVDTPLSSTFSDFEALEESLLEFKECLRTSFTLMAWGYAHNLSPTSLGNLLDDSISLNRILKTLRHILDLHPLPPRGFGKPAPDFDDIGDYIAETLVKSISKGSKILLERLTFISQEGSREPTGLHWFWGADAALDHFPHHLLPEKSYQRSVSFEFSSETQEELGKRLEKFLDLYEELLNKRPLLEFSDSIFSERSDLIKRMIKANKDIISLAKEQVGFSMPRYILRHCNLWKFCLNQVDHMLQTAIQDFEILETRALEEINVVHWSVMESLSDRILMFRRELEKLLESNAGPIPKISITNPALQHSQIQPKVK